MRLLIITQAVDRDDPILGFFHRWIEEFAANVDQVDVVCLRTGSYALPQNVAVHSLGKEEGRGRFTYVIRLIGHAIGLKYDAVFVHMNPIYVVLLGLWWRLTGKEIGLWYTHKTVDVKLRIAEYFAHHIFTASTESFRLKTQKLHVMNHGIDIEFFAAGAAARGTHLLSVGRLMKTKRHDLAIQAAAQAGRELRIVGDGEERVALEAVAQEAGAQVVFLGAKTQEELRAEYQSAAGLIHTSETGSLDKVVLEALACGTPVVTTSAAYPNAPVVHSAAEPEAIAAAIQTLPPPGYPELASYVATQHSVRRLVPRIVSVYAGGTI